MKITWKSILKTNFSRLDELMDFLELNNADRKLLLQKPDFPLNVPRRIASKMQKGTLDDPIAKQFLPHILEDEDNTGFSYDPNEEKLHQLAPKMLKKYEGRTLIISTSACAMHCRYCFRQNFPYETTDKSFAKELEQIRSDSSIFEAILSGGDPLSLSDRRLGELLHAIEQIPHVKIIRFHTRFPIGIPERIDSDFLALLKSIKKQIVFVVHVNHPRELDEEVLTALKKVGRLGIPILSQSVLLQGVNDHIDILVSLFQRLSQNGIIPYYLHQLDRVRGSSRFEVDQKKGAALIEEVRKRLPGYAVPQYVKEIPGMLSKTPL